MKNLLLLNVTLGLILGLTGCSNKGIIVPSNPVKIDPKEVMSEEELLKKQAADKKK